MAKAFSLFNSGGKKKKGRKKGKRRAGTKKRVSSKRRKGVSKRRSNPRKKRRGIRRASKRRTSRKRRNPFTDRKGRVHRDSGEFAKKKSPRGPQRRKSRRRKYRSNPTRGYSANPSAGLAAVNKRVSVLTTKVTDIDSRTRKQGKAIKHLSKRMTMIDGMRKSMGLPALAGSKRDTAAILDWKRDMARIAKRGYNS